MKAGAFLALCGMLTTVMGLFVTLRYWFLASRWLSERQPLSLPLLSIIAFWSIFIIAVFILIKFRQHYTDAFESVVPSLVERLLGAVFGLVSGLAVMTALMMTLSIASPMFWPAYHHDELPLPVDRWALQAYRFVETRFAGFGAKEPGHTFLPSLKEENTDKPANFWQ